MSVAETTKETIEDDIQLVCDVFTVLPEHRDVTRAVVRVTEALRLAILMNQAQVIYFGDRTQDNLVAARQAEAAFRKAIA